MRFAQIRTSGRVYLRVDDLDQTCSSSNKCHKIKYFQEFCFFTNKQTSTALGSAEHLLWKDRARQELILKKRSRAQVWKHTRPRFANLRSCSIWSRDKSRWWMHIHMKHRSRINDKMMEDKMIFWASITYNSHTKTAWYSAMKLGNEYCAPFPPSDGSSDKACANCHCITAPCIVCLSPRFEKAISFLKYAFRPNKIFLETCFENRKLSLRKLTRQKCKVLNLIKNRQGCKQTCTCCGSRSLWPVYLPRWMFHFNRKHPFLIRNKQTRPRVTCKDDVLAQSRLIFRHKL